MASAEDLEQMVGDMGDLGSLEKKMAQFDRQRWNEFVGAMQEHQEVMLSALSPSSLMNQDRRQLQELFDVIDPTSADLPTANCAEILISGFIVSQIDTHSRSSLEFKSAPARDRMEVVRAAVCEVNHFRRYPSTGPTIDYLGIIVRDVLSDDKNKFEEYLDKGEVFVPAENLKRR